MTSAIDPSVPVTGTPTTASVRANFQHAYDEIIALQNAIPLASTTPPIMDAAAAVGVGGTWARSDHAHPSDTSRYPTSNPSGYQTAAQVAPAYNATGRNVLHNPLFNIGQRGNGPWTTANTYTADRWQISNSFDTMNVSIQAANDGIRTAVNDESAANFLDVFFTGNANANSYTVLFQPIDNVRRLAGKTVTVSFYAYSSAQTKIGVSIDQNFGTGGSPSAPAFNSNGISITTGAVWGRYSVTLAVPSASGKVVGTNGNDFSQLNIWLSSGSAVAPRSGNVGVQAGEVQLWGLQLEVGSVMTQLEKPDPGYDLANARRFYATGYFNYFGSTGAVNSNISVTQSFSVGMRATPTITTSGTSVVNLTGPNVTPATPTGFYIAGVTAGPGSFGYYGTYQASADL